MPDFVKDEIKLGDEFKALHPESFKTIQIKNRDLFFTQIGASGAPKIIFIHGSPGSWGSFVKVLNRPTLSKSALVIAADRLGFGGSSRGGVARTLGEQAAAMIKLLDLDDPKQSAILVGHSFGGPVVAKMAAMNDPRIKSVLILAGSVDPNLEKTKWYQIPADWLILKWAIPKDLVTCNEEILALKPELEILSKQWTDMTARLTVVQGLDDDLVPPGNADFIQEKARHLHPNIIRIPNRNHFLQVYENDLIEKILLEELSIIRGQK